MTTPFVEVTLRLRMEFDASSMSWIEELTDKAREQAEVLLVRMDNMPSSVVLEGEDATLKAHFQAAMRHGGS